MTLNSAAINNAIAECAKQGGGTVLIPRGSFVTGPIMLKSNINLHLAEGALVIFTPDFDQYPLVVSTFEGVEAARCQSPVTAENIENIAITGKGIERGTVTTGGPFAATSSPKGMESAPEKYGGVLSEDQKTWYFRKALKGFNDKPSANWPEEKIK